MDFTEEQKKALEHKLVESIIVGLEDEKIDIHDLHPIADSILEKIDHLKTTEEVEGFIKHLSGKWNIFHSLAQ